MSRYYGDFNAAATVRIPFNTNQANGTPITLVGGAISVYKDGSTTESTTGVTLAVDFDSRTGLHLVTIDASADGTFYSAGSDFRAILTAGTVDSISVVGSAVGSFSIANRSALRPTTAGRTLDVSSGGEAGIDWANVGSPTTSVGLSGTTVSTSQAVASVSGAVGSVTGDMGGKVLGGGSGTITGVGVNANLTQINGIAAATSDGTAQAGVAGSITLASGASSVNSTYVDRTVTITGGTGIGQSRIITAYVGATKVATVHRNWDTTPDNTSTYSIGSTAAANVVEWLGSTPNALISGRVDANTQATASVLTFGLTGNITGNLSGSVGSVTAGVTVTTNNDKTGYTASTVSDKTGYSLTTAPPTAAAIATAVWTTTTASDFATASSPGKILVTQLGGAFTTTASSVFTTASLANGPSGSGSSPTTIAAAVWSAIAVNTTTYGKIAVATGAVLAGKLTENAGHTTSSFADINDPATPRVTSVNTSTTRTVTVN